MPHPSEGSPAVSVVLPVHNGEPYVREAVESILAQSLSDFELVAVDDGSTDGTATILADYASRDSRIFVSRQANAGSVEARNNGFRLATAPLVASFDADDVALPSRLELQYEFMTHHPEVAVAGGAVAFIDADGRQFGEWRYPLTDAEIRSAFAHTTPLAHPATMIRKDVFFSVGGYRRLPLAQDLDLWLRIAERHEFANLPDVMIRYRIHPEQGTIRNCEEQALGSLAARIGARARAEGRPDPVDTIERVDRQTLLRIGATEDDVASAVVHAMTWLAKTVGRAGYIADSERLFLDARDRAQAASRSPELTAHVHRQHAHIYREQGRRVPYVLEALRAARAGAVRGSHSR